MAFEIKRDNVNPRAESENVNLSAEEEQRVQDALEALAKDPHAPREISVKLTLHIHHEYPKHVIVDDKTVVVNDPDEEKSASAGVRPRAGSGVQGAQRQGPIMPGVQLDSALHAESPSSGSGLVGGARPEASSGTKLVDNSAKSESPDTSNLTEMSKAERKEELGGMSKAELREVAEQHDVHTDSSMNKGKITSALNRQLNKEAKTGTE